MQEFKSKKTKIFKEIAYGFIGGIFLSYILNKFLRIETALIIGILFFLLIIYWSTVIDNIKVVIDGDELIFYRGKKEKYRFVISQCSFSSSIESSDGVDICTLVVKTIKKETAIDCSMLGSKNYEKLLDILEINETISLAAVKKSKGGLDFGLIFVAVCLIILGVTALKERYFEKSIFVINNKTATTINSVRLIYVKENKVIDVGDIKRKSKYKHKIDTNRTGAILLEYKEYKKKTYRYKAIPEITSKMDKVEVIFDNFDLGKIKIKKRSK